MTRTDTAKLIEHARKWHDGNERDCAARNTPRDHTYTLLGRLIAALEAEQSERAEVTARGMLRAARIAELIAERDAALGALAKERDLRECAEKETGWIRGSLGELVTIAANDHGEIDGAMSGWDAASEFVAKTLHRERARAEQAERALAKPDAEGKGRALTGAYRGIAPTTEEFLAERDQPGTNPNDAKGAERE